MKMNPRIEIEKTLHLENASVHSMHYTSFDKPILKESVTVEGENLVRISEDNGRTWDVQGERDCEDIAGDRIVTKLHPIYFLDDEHNILIEFMTEHEKLAAAGEMSFGSGAANDRMELRTGRIFYRFSKDEGKTWSDKKQLIQKGPQYDEIHWADGVYYGKNTCNCDELLRVIKLKDGAVIVPVWFWRLGEDGEFLIKPDRFGDMIWPAIASACFRGQWRDDLSDIDWEMSNHLILPEYMSRALGEPAIAELDNGKLIAVMRGSADVRQAFPSVKFFAISKDGGRSWGPSVPLTYPNNSLAYSPASLPNLFRSSKNGKLYLIANILSQPTRGCDPRDILQIAEVDQEYFWIIPETVTVIDSRKEHHPGYIRFSNWQRIEDRETRNPVIFMTENAGDLFLPGKSGKVSQHSYRYEIKLPD